LHWLCHNHDDYRHVTIVEERWALFAIAASLDLEIHQMDVVSVFLASKLKEKIYMEVARRI